MTRDESDINIAELLAVALDDEPSEGFADRVLDHLAVIKTAVEFGRLVGRAPADFLTPDDDGLASPEDEDKDHEDDDESRPDHDDDE